MSTRLERAREVLEAEAAALQHAAEHLDERFLVIVEAILDLRGKVVLTGVGKSGLIAQKIAATLSSTGTPALFMQSVEATHGDLGILSRDDLLIAISSSGETSEVVNVVHAAGQIGTPAVAVTSNTESTLARECKYLLPLNVSGEVGPLGLAPTTSTTVTLGLGDALAMVLMAEKEFTSQQFKLLHPGGSLGRRLSLRVSDLMRTGEQIPAVRDDVSYEDALREMSLKELGMTLVLDERDRIKGIITDGDIRRANLSGESNPTVTSLMTPNPRSVEADALASEALRMMEVNANGAAITALVVLDPMGRAAGVVNLHDILGRGQFVL